MIKDHREKNKESGSQISDIFGSIHHWSEALSDRIEKLVDKYQNLTSAVANNADEGSLFPTKINEFVKYRNDITHGRYRVITQDIAKTSFIIMIMGLAYGCSLMDIGLSEKEVADLMRKKILS